MTYSLLFLTIILVNIQAVIIPGNPCLSNSTTIYGGSDFSATSLCNITVGGYARDYYVHIPLNFNPSLGLVLVLHGTNQNGLIIQSYSNWTNKSDDVGVMVIYPNGINTTWLSANSG